MGILSNNALVPASVKVNVFLRSICNNNKDLYKRAHESVKSKLHTDLQRKLFDLHND